MTNLAVLWEQPDYRRFCERLGSFTRLILFDKRGMGLSERVQIGTLEERMDDVRAVLDAVGSEQAALLGVSEGGPMSILFAATYPERARALILCGAEVKEEKTDDWPWGRIDERRIRGVDCARPRTLGQGAVAGLLRPEQRGDDQPLAWFGRLRCSPEARARPRSSCGWRSRSTSVTSFRPSRFRPCSSPVGDLVSHVENGRWLARTIAGARLVELPGADHLPLIDADDILDEIQEFLTGVREPAEPERVLATVLFTDVVGSTEKARELGDRRWRDLLDRHNEIVRRDLERFRGREVDTAGDGFFATFDGPARAIRCARSIVADVQSVGLEVRAGLHTGECELAGDQVRGIAVHTGARVASLAGAGEVLVSSTVRDLVAGSGIEFAERGVQSLKGIPGEWRLYAVA